MSVSGYVVLHVESYLTAECASEVSGLDWVVSVDYPGVAPSRISDE